MSLSGPFLDADRLLRETFLADVRLFAQLPSTNDYAHAAAREGARTPLLIVADEQTAGRGRGANRWMTGAGALTFSLLLEPRKLGMPLASWPILSLACGASVALALETLLGPRADVRVKWPNDVYLEGAKVCGILVETPKSSPDSLIIGIGINVNNLREAAPPEVQKRMISLADVAGQELPRTDVLIEVLQQLRRQFDAVAEVPEAVIESCRARCFLTGRLLSVSDGVRTVSGTCLGLDDDGALRVATAEGQQRCVAGSVELLD